jgi:hypothetical protein
MQQNLYISITFQNGRLADVFKHAPLIIVEKKKLNVLMHVFVVLVLVLKIEIALGIRKVACCQKYFPE